MVRIPNTTKVQMRSIVKDAYNHCNKGSGREMDSHSFQQMSAYINTWHSVWNLFKDADIDHNFRIDLKEWKKSELSSLFGRDYGRTDVEKFKRIDKNNSGALTADEIMWEITMQMHSDAIGQTKPLLIDSPDHTLPKT